MDISIIDDIADERDKLRLDVKRLRKQLAATTAERDRLLQKLKEQEGYGGIAHDMLKLEAERDDAIREIARLGRALGTLQAAAQRVVDFFDRVDLHKPEKDAMNALKEALK